MSETELKLPVTFTLTDGRVLDGDLVVQLGGTVDRTINSESRFVTFADMDDKRRFIAKDIIGEIVAHKRSSRGTEPKLPGENQRPDGKLDDNDPYALLGISREATVEEIRAAWVKRARDYHSDRFATTELPREVRAYTESMSRRINDAHARLLAARNAPAAAPKPVIIPASI